MSRTESYPIKWCEDRESELIRSTRSAVMKSMPQRKAGEEVLPWFLSFGGGSCAGSHYSRWLNHLQGEVGGEIVRNSSPYESDPARYYTCVLLHNFSTFELIEWKDVPDRLLLFSNGSYLGWIEECDQSEPDAPWYRKIIDSFRIPRKWQVHVGLETGTITTGPCTGSIRLELKFPDFVLPVHISRNRGKKVPASEDFRRLQYEHDMDTVIPWGTPRVKCYLVEVQFCVNIAFRMHYFQADFSDSGGD